MASGRARTALINESVRGSLGKVFQLQKPDDCLASETGRLRNPLWNSAQGVSSYFPGSLTMLGYDVPETGSDWLKPFLPTSFREDLSASLSVVSEAVEQASAPEWPRCQNCPRMAIDRLVQGHLAWRVPRRPNRPCAVRRDRGPNLVATHSEEGGPEAFRATTDRFKTTSAVKLAKRNIWSGLVCFIPG